MLSKRAGDSLFLERKYLEDRSAERYTYCYRKILSAQLVNEHDDSQFIVLCNYPLFESAFVAWCNDASPP